MAVARVKPFKPFRPFVVPSSPPPSTYDPALDAGLEAARRGLFDLGQDVQTQNARDTTDYGLGVAELQRGGDRATEDIASQRAALGQSQSRSLEDLARSRGYLTENHDQALGALHRSYGILAGRQRQQDNAYGVLRGGAALQAASKRQANQAVDQQPIDSAFRRGVAENDVATGRVNQDAQTQTGLLDRAATRSGEDLTSQLGRLAISLAPPDEGNPLGGRSFQDRGTQLTRGRRELTAFGLDTASAKNFQAAGSGWDPLAGRAKNEFTDKQGNAYRTVTRGRMVFGIDQHGKVLWQRPVRTRRR